MKKIIHLFCASLFLLVSCTEDVALEVNLVSEPFFASVEGTTRTYADENGKLLWTANDRITIFKGTTYPLVYQFTGSTGDNYGGFNDVTTSLGEFETSNALSANYAVYPYAANTSISNEGVINYTIPTTQTYAENSFGLGANVMVAVTENTEDKHLSFKNVGGYFEFSLYGEDITVKSIAFSGNNGEKLAGNVSITATHNGTPSVAFADDATTTITLDCGEGVELGADAEHATKFWFVVPAITYEKGITITITDTEGKVMEKSTSKSIAIERSTVQPLAAFEVETHPVIPTNQIWYTSTSGEVVTPYKTDVFGANIVSNVYENGKGIITFDGSVSSIGYGAFWFRDSLTSITIPDSVTSIGKYAFFHCSLLTSITIHDGVTSIGERAFYNCSSLTSITIPDGVTSIDQLTFSGCSSMTTITIPNSVTSIGQEAFHRCTSLTDIAIPSGVTSIGGYVFSGCSSLTNITIPNGVTSIEDYAFYGCSSLTNITLPDSVTSIGNLAFDNCSSLTSIIIPDGVTSIGESAFDYCSSLTSITLPDSVTSIRYGAFALCSSLASITLPDGVTSIGENAFYDCSSLTTVYSKNTTPPLAGNYMFYNCHSQLKIYVPTSSVSAYQSADGWSEYASKIEGTTF